MASEAALLLAGIRSLNTFLVLRREIGVTFDEVQRLMERAEAEGREITVNDLGPLAEQSDTERAQLREAIRQARLRERP